LHQTIGKGSYGFVVKAVHRASGKMVALKIMKNPVVTEYEIIKLLRELQIMRRLCKIQLEVFDHHAFIPELLDVLKPSSPDEEFYVCMVLEYF